MLQGGGPSKRETKGDRETPRALKAAEGVWTAFSPARSPPTGGWAASGRRKDDVGGLDDGAPASPSGPGGANTGPVPDAALPCLPSVNLGPPLDRGRARSGLAGRRVVTPPAEVPFGVGGRFRAPRFSQLPRKPSAVGGRPEFGNRGFDGSFSGNVPQTVDIMGVDKRGSEAGSAKGFGPTSTDLKVRAQQGRRHSISMAFQVRV